MSKNEKQPEKTYIDIHDWLITEEIKNEKGELIEFDNHPFLFDIYADQAQFLTIMKAAQVGLTTCEMLKNHFDAKQYKLDIIYCVDEETEILTKKGFIRQEELKNGDEILTLNKSGSIQWSKTQEVFRKKVDMDMRKFEARNFNAMVTPNHRWLLQPYRGAGEMFFRETDDMIGKYARIPKSLENNGATPKEKIYTDEYIELLSWIFSEGYYCKQKNKNDYSIIISQSEIKNPHLCDQIRYAMRKMDISWKEYKNNHNGTINFRFAGIHGQEIKKRFPKKEPDIDFINSLTREQHKLFIEIFVKGDGWIDKSGTMAFSQKSKQTTEMLVLSGIYAGYVPSIQYPTKTRDWHTVRYTQFKTVETNELVPKTIQYKGIIWCPRTEHGTFYARRNGRCYWTGNTLPTDGDVKVMVGGKTNRIIANNPCMIADVADKDSVESKKVGNSMIYFRGTWTKKAAMMTPADRVVHDEKDSSKLDIISDYQARLQHSKFKQTHTFSHPSLPETGVHADWLKSDQKHWFIKCPHCNKWQYLSWDTENPDKMSIDIEKKVFICKKCKKQLPEYARREGQWVAKYPERKISGYWVPLLIAPWISAEYIVEKYQEPQTTKEFFYTKILGLPYADASSKLLRKSFLQNLTGKIWAPDESQRVVIGIDTGLRLDYVIGNIHGLFYHGDTDKYGELDVLMRRWPKAIAVIDAGGDLIGSRAFAERWAGRVFLLYFGGDRKQNDIITFGEGDKYGQVTIDRNRGIQLVVDEFREKRIPVHGTEQDWFEYWLDWNSLSKIKVLDPDTNQTKGYKWVRSGRDHRALATVCWRAGMSRFAGMGDIIKGEVPELKPNSYMINPVDQTADFNPEELFDLMEDQQENDWRATD